MYELVRYSYRSESNIQVKLFINILSFTFAIEIIFISLTTILIKFLIILIQLQFVFFI
jgi:hypothetical protein